MQCNPVGKKQCELGYLASQVGIRSPRTTSDMSHL